MNPVSYLDTPEVDIESHLYKAKAGIEMHVRIGDLGQETGFLAHIAQRDNVIVLLNVTRFVYDPDSCTV